MRLAPTALLVLAACASARGSSSDGGARPASFVLSTADARTTRAIDLRDGVSRTQAMRAVNEVLGQRYTVDVSDARAGIVMTGWAPLTRDGVPDLRYRTRLTARFSGEDWKRLQLHSEAHWARGEEWEVGYDSAQLDSVASDIRTRIGKRQ